MFNTNRPKRGCNMFVSESFYRQAVDLYWKRPVPFDVTKQGTPILRSLCLMNFNIYNKHILGQQNFQSSTILTLYQFYSILMRQFVMWNMGPRRRSSLWINVDCAEAKLSKDFHFSTTCNWLRDQLNTKSLSWSWPQIYWLLKIGGIWKKKDWWVTTSNDSFQKSCKTDSKYAVIYTYCETIMFQEIGMKSQTPQQLVFGTSPESGLRIPKRFVSRWEFLSIPSSQADR